MAKRARAVGKRERHDNEITALNRPNVCADVFNHTHCFVPHHATDVAAFHFLIRPQIAPAHARASDTNESVSRLNDLRIGHVLDPNVASFIHDSCAQNYLPPVTLGLRLNTNSGNLFSSLLSTINFSRAGAGSYRVVPRNLSASQIRRYYACERFFGIPKERI